MDGRGSILYWGGGRWSLINGLNGPYLSERGFSNRHECYERRTNVVEGIGKDLELLPPPLTEWSGARYEICGSTSISF